MTQDNSEIKAEKGRQASIEGFANEHIALGILMKKYQNVSLVDLPLSSYDIIIVLREDNRESFIRVQSKTASKTISFTGGTRGGVDREYKSGVKEYIQSPKTSDVVVGVNLNQNGVYDLYFVSTILISHLQQKSISLSKIQFTKNNYDLLEQCKNEKYVLNLAKAHNLLKDINSDSNENQQ